MFHEFVRDIPLKENHRTWKTLKGIEDKLSEIKDEQILICWGKHDFCFNDSFLQTWKQKFPTAECHEFEAGHYLMEDKLDEIFPYIEQKLK